MTGRPGDRPAAELATARLVLRPLRSADLAALVAYRRDPDVARYQSWDVDYSAADAEGLLAEVGGVSLGDPGAGLQLAVVDRGNGTLVGDCYSRVGVDPPATAEIGLTVAPPFQGRGLGREAAGALVGALFARYGLHRVLAQADERNQAIHRVLASLGFRLEGRLVEADWCKGEWTTLRVYAVLEREWAGG
ncbi:MAG: GNAT family N-acetyltransferase [Solirubrobacteraceae bacterium]